MPEVSGSAVPVRAEGYGWRHAGRRRPALKDLDLHVEAGERVLLLGASGAGKSTLLHALAGLLTEEDAGGEQSGRLSVGGLEPRRARGRAGLVLQDPDSQVVLSRVGDEVAFGAENLRVPAAQIPDRVARALSDVGLGHLPAGHPTAALSGGQKQRLALAAVLAMEPGLLLLDEPTANLDPGGVLEVRDAVARSVQRTGATLIVVEHRTAVWAEVVNRVIVLAGDGGLLADGPPEQVLGHGPGRAALAAAGVWLPGLDPLAGSAPAPRRGAPADGEPLLTAAGVAVGRSRNAAPVLSGVNLQLRAGSVTGLLGPNGAGKTTLALALGGLAPVLAGTLRAEPALAAGLAAEPLRWKPAQLIQRIGSVFQEPEHQFLTGTVRDELAYGPRRAGREREAAARIEELAERLRLAHLLAANPFTLSGGEKRRLSVATVLAATPRVLLLDEPTFGQDAITWAQLVRLLAEQADQGRAVLAVTHDADFTAALGAGVVRLGTAEQDSGQDSEQQAGQQPEPQGESQRAGR